MSKHFEIVIVGAGPAGLGAATNAAKHNLSHLLIEKNEVGNTIFEYQLRKHVMAEPGKLPLRAHVPFEAGTRESILDAWNKSLTDNKVNFEKGDVTSIKKDGDLFKIEYSGQVCSAAKVILSMGIQGSPRKLGVPGEDLPHVSYTLRDPDAFVGKDILVVGAGDAAIENAIALCDKNKVSILNRTEDFARAKDGNNSLIMKAIESKKIRCFYNSNLERVESDKVFINSAKEGLVELKCNQIIARIGAIPPRKFLESCGIVFPSGDITAVPVVSKNYESNVPGLFILGSLIGYPLIKQAINQGYEVIEHLVGNDIEPADQVLIDERLKHISKPINETYEMIRASLPLFKDLSDSQYRELIIDSTLHQLQKGTVIFEKNDFTDTFFSIVSGKATIKLPDGSDLNVESGNFFGEIGLLSGRRRTATVVAGEDSLLLETPRKQMLKLIASVDSIKHGIDLKFMQNALATSIFPDVESHFLADLAMASTIRVFKKGEVIFSEGEPGEELFVIRKGSVKISRRDTKDNNITQTYLAAGNFFGEMALISEEVTPRNATVTAAVGCETIIISKSDFQFILERNPEAKKRILTLIKEREIENITSNQNAQAGTLLDFMLSQGISDADNVLLIDSDLCIGCDNCERACAATHDGYSRLDRKGGKSFASIQVPISCRHCENPLCMLDCPPDALIRKPDGEVIIQDSCIGCGNCVSNCPYGVIQMVYPKEQAPFSLFAMLGFSKKESNQEKGPAKAGKCDMCSKLNGGPACVRSCPTGAAMRVNPRRMLEIISDKQGRYL